MGLFVSEEKERARQVERRAKEQLHLAAELVSKHEVYGKNIRIAYTELRKKEVCRIFSLTDVEQINFTKEGIRVVALRRNGISNLLQLYRISDRELLAINGIGEQMVGAIRRNCATLWENAMQTATVRMSVDSPDEHGKMLIKCLYLLMNERELMEEALAVGRNLMQAYEQPLRQVRSLTSGLRWTFTFGEKRQEALLALDQLELFTTTGDALRLMELARRDAELCALPEERIWAVFRENAAPFYALLEEIMGASVDTSVAGNDLPKELIEEVKAFVPELSQLRASLRSYQEFGVKYILHQKRVLLGDEMGLGKTMQAIAAMVHLQSTGRTHFLVVCPLSVFVNWQREIRKFSNLYTIGIYGDDRLAMLGKWCLTGGVAVTTYETLSRVEIPEDVALDMLIVDEAVYVKNEEAQRTQCVLELVERAEWVLYMTGTPLENHVDEMCYLIGCLQPEAERQATPYKQLVMAVDFRRAIAPVYLRRRRDDVLKELPPLLEKEQWCTCSEEELALYIEALREGRFMEARQVSWNVPDIRTSTKAGRLWELCEQAREAGEKVLVFSFFRETLQRLEQMLGNRCVGRIDGSVSVADRQRYLDAFAATGPGAVLVCQIQAGGVGLNIQSASVVIFCEPQLKPSLEVQAVARAYRMGQTRTVSVHRLLMEDTVDEHLLEVLKTKQRAFDAFADRSVIGAMSLEEMQEEETAIDEKQLITSILAKEREFHGITGAPAAEVPESEGQTEEAAPAEESAQAAKSPEEVDDNEEARTEASEPCPEEPSNAPEETHIS